MKPLVSMRAALGDDDLLGKALPDPSWSAWRTMLIAAMGEALTDDERKDFAELTGREREPRVRAEEVHAIVGRRSGKTKAAAAGDRAYPRESRQRATSVSHWATGP